jgi:alpha-N-acetylglucosamine transferase
MSDITKEVSSPEYPEGETRVYRGLNSKVEDKSSVHTVGKFAIDAKKIDNVMRKNATLIKIDPLIPFQVGIE